jgi:glycogen debranching enzyme
MPIEITVASPGITISQGRTFMLTNERGEIASHTDEGVYAIDTRFFSFYRLFINREPWTIINASQLTFYASKTHYSNPVVTTDAGEIPANTLRLTVDRAVSQGIHEDFYLENYSGKQITVMLELELRSDFADLFEVKSKSFVQRGKTQTTWNNQHDTLRTSYDNQDFHRAAIYRVPNSVVPVEYANGRIVFEVALAPGQKWHSCGEMILEHGHKVRRPLYSLCSQLPISNPTSTEEEAEPQDFDERQARWQARCTGVNTPNEHVYRMYRQAVEDMGALRIYDLDVSDEAWVPAAGVPWFVTLFGRDSLIASLQNMSVSPGFARGALKRLAEYQATERDDWRDAQPGKILHEIRFGELAHFHKIPHTPYYGTADATILYLIVLSEAYRWTADLSLLHNYRDVAERCLQWIDQWGDLDGDGFQEYKTYSSLGYENVSWKDAGDAVVYADGTQVKQPKALCELQGYVYDAKTRMAEVFEVLGDSTRAQSLREQAATLKQKFNELFWIEEEGCFAYGLDPDKHQITSIASNPGHCLWSGIADPQKAARTAKRLLQSDMWTGWGIRTLSSLNPAYNPLSYQNGSVWPHDNGIIAAGFKHYGLIDEANQVIRGIFDAARRFDAYRLPEVYAGLHRQGKHSDFPALYPGGANIPQAWASGSIFQMLQAILGLRADAPHRTLYVWPTLPEWLPEIELQHLRVGRCILNLRFWLDGSKSHWQVTSTTLDAGANPEELIQVLDEPTPLTL